MESKNKCENCKFYHHSPNVLGGVAECRKEVKWLSTFWQNDACNKFEATPTTPTVAAILSNLDSVIIRLTILVKSLSVNLIIFVIN